MSQPITNGNEYRLREIIELEKDLLKTVGNSTVREADFRRVGLPLLTGLLDDTFSEKSWAEYVGSYHVALDIYSTDEKTVLFTIPPLLQNGPSLINVPGQASLTEEVSDTYRSLGSGPMADEAIGQLILTTVKSMNEMTREDDIKRAVGQITILNKIFEYYGVKGRLEVPDLAEILPGTQEAAAAVVEQPKPQATQYNFDDGEDL